MRLFAIPALALLASCATAGGPSQPVDSITFETTACFGSCPIFSIAVDAQGNGTYRGERFVAQKGEHGFSASPAELQAFLARIEPFRPDGAVAYDYEHCSVPVSTDSPSVKVTWQSDQGTDSLSWYLGCREPAILAIEPGLYEAWQELPLDDLVGTKENRFDYERGKS